MGTSCRSFFFGIKRNETKFCFCLFYFVSRLPLLLISGMKCTTEGVFSSLPPGGEGLGGDPLPPRGLEK